MNGVKTAQFESKCSFSRITVSFMATLWQHLKMAFLGGSSRI